MDSGHGFPAAADPGPVREAAPATAADLPAGPIERPEKSTQILEKAESAPGIPTPAADGGDWAAPPADPARPEPAAAAGAPDDAASSAEAPSGPSQHCGRPENPLQAVEILDSAPGPAANPYPHVIPMRMLRNGVALGW